MSLLVDGVGLDEMGFLRTAFVSSKRGCG